MQRHEPAQSVFKGPSPRCPCTPDVHSTATCRCKRTWEHTWRARHTRVARARAGPRMHTHKRAREHVQIQMCVHRQWMPCGIAASSSLCSAQPHGQAQARVCPHQGV